jgi:hypothetical protein
MRRLMWITMVVVGVMLAIGLFARVSSADYGVDAHSPLGAPGTFYKTFTGTDFHTLDGDDLLRFASGTGGGVWVKSRAIGSG